MLDQTKRTVAYEWVFIMNKGDDVFMTEPQYKFFKENIKESKVVFSDFGISPSFVVQFFKRPATSWLKNKYPCKKCFSSGRNLESTDWCDDCGGSGVTIPRTT